MGRGPTRARKVPHAEGRQSPHGVTSEPVGPSTEACVPQRTTLRNKRRPRNSGLCAAAGEGHTPGACTTREATAGRATAGSRGGGPAQGGRSPAHRGRRPLSDRRPRPGREEAPPREKPHSQRRPRSERRPRPGGRRPCSLQPEKDRA